MKYIYGTNIDACIFSFYNPEYRLIESGNKFQPDETVKTILDIAIRIFANPYTEKLLMDLNLPLHTKQLKITKNISNYAILSDKITDCFTGKKLELNELYSTKEIDIGKTDIGCSTIYCIPFSELKTALYKAVEHRIINNIPFNDTDEFISCIPNNKAAELGIGIEKVDTLPSTFSISSQPQYLKPEIIYHNGKRIFLDGYYIVSEVTGAGKGDLVINESRIQPNFYNSYPANIEPLGRFAENNPEHRIEDTIKRALMHANPIYRLYQDQKKINKIYQPFPVSLEEKQRQTEKFLLHLNRQAYRLLDNVNWKLNQPNRPIQRKQIVEDWCDMFKYWLSIGLVWEIDWKEMLDELNRKTEAIFYKEQ